jgi:hypothetical protein
MDSIDEFYNLDNITIIDNFLPEEEYLKLFETVSKKSRWTFTSRNRPIEGQKFTDFEESQFVHGSFTCRDIVNKTPGILNKMFFSYTPIIRMLKCDLLLRIKTNMYAISPELEQSSRWHVDYEKYNGAGMTAIYYFNTCNGKTEFKNGTFVDSVANRIVIFPNEFVHGGVRQNDVMYRFVVNINWLHYRRLKDNHGVDGKDLEQLYQFQKRHYPLSLGPRPVILHE